MIEYIKNFIEYIVQGFLDNWVIYALSIPILISFGCLLYSAVKERIESPAKGFCIINIEHAEHKYIIFYKGRENGVVHDPDCWCNQ
jgi:hypothetical protein